jgi:hypothetical protein
MCQNRSLFRTAKSIMITTLSEVAAWLRTDCDDDPAMVLSTDVEMSTSSGMSDAQFFVGACI